MNLQGTEWSPAEWKKLRYWEKTGLPVSRYWQRFPGRNKNMVAKAVTRLRKKRSGKRNSENLHGRRMNQKEFKLFVAFLRKHEHAPTAQLTLSWNYTARKLGIPEVTAGTVTTTRTRFSNPASPKEQRSSEFHQNGRRLRSANLRVKTFAETEKAFKADYERKYAAYRKSQKDGRIETCRTCGHPWPLSALFFQPLPGACFGPASSRNIAFNIELCRACLDALTWLQRSYRRAGLLNEAQEIAKRKQASRWLSAERVLLKEAETAHEEAQDKFPSSRGIPWETCLRCRKSWPLVDDYWRPIRNLSSAKANPALCTFCRRYYRGYIRRLQAAGEDLFPVKWEQEEFMHQGRMRYHETKRKEARRLKRGKLKLGKKRCRGCGEFWPSSSQHRKQFWILSRYTTAGGKQQIALSKDCRFCRREAVASANWEKKTKEAFKRKSIKKKG